MTLDNYIEQLQKLQARGYGDRLVVPSVRDYYTRRSAGHNAKMHIDASASVSGGYFVTDGYVTLDINLTPDYDGKSPKITYRK